MRRGRRGAVTSGPTAAAAPGDCLIDAGDDGGGGIMAGCGALCGFGSGGGCGGGGSWGSGSSKGGEGTGTADHGRLRWWGVVKNSAGRGHGHGGRNPGRVAGTPTQSIEVESSRRGDDKLWMRCFFGEVCGEHCGHGDHHRTPSAREFFMTSTRDSRHGLSDNRSGGD